MANESLKVGDVVISKASSNPKMVISKVEGNFATCYYFNQITATFSRVELSVECLMKA